MKKYISNLGTSARIIKFILVLLVPIIILLDIYWGFNHTPPKHIAPVVKINDNEIKFKAIGIISEFEYGVAGSLGNYVCDLFSDNIISRLGGSACANTVNTQIGGISYKVTTLMYSKGIVTATLTGNSGQKLTLTVGVDKNSYKILSIQ